MGSKIWTDYRIKEWCRHFISKNHKLPTVYDLSNVPGSPLTPPIIEILKKYGSVENLINKCGGFRGGNKIFTFRELKASFEKFFAENGYFPTAYDVDSCPYLPSSRTIQRSWGGLVNLRRMLKIDIDDQRKGETRVKMAKRVWDNAILSENNLEIYLVQVFGEIFVHTQKRIGNVNADFFIYTPELKFAIDIFRYTHKASLGKIINYKSTVYKNYPHMVIFLPDNELLGQEELDALLSRRKNLLPIQCKVMCLSEFKKWIGTLKSYNFTTVPTQGNNQELDKPKKPTK